MNFLPIVTRELRVTSRRKSTYRLRALAALVAVALSFFFLLIFRFWQTPNIGPALFGTLSYYAFALCLVSGVFVTADALSEERREGTLGLLFLTDLKGYDVVLGKFLAKSLNAIYGLVGIFPILALPLMLGGVTGGEFWRMTLALLNALFFSLALGTLISAGSRDSQKALGRTLAWLIVLGVLLPLLNLVRNFYPLPAIFWKITSISPFQAFQFSFEKFFVRNASEYRFSLFASHLLAWVFLALASIRVRSAWQDKPFESAVARKKFWNFNSGGRVKNESARGRLLDKNPILWLMSGARQWHVAIWAIVALAALVVAAMLLFGKKEFILFSFWLNWPFLILLKLILALRASQFFSESRRSGALELLLTTPLTNREIVQGQWLALRRMFQWPVIGMAAVILFPIAAHLLFGEQRDVIPTSVFALSGGLFGLVKFVAEVLAIGWFGMWMGLSCKKPNLASAWTVLVAVVLPTVLVMCCWADFVLAIVLIFVAKGKLELDLRRYLTQTRFEAK